jgi:DNA polymerase-3 subunit beta
MKLSCTQENLSKALSIVSRSVGTRATLPVLSNILMQTDKGRLKLSATDLEIGIHTWLGAKVDADGAITVPARLLTDFVSNNSDKNINVELKESSLHLESDRFKANIKGIEASEFPLIPEVAKMHELEIKGADLAKAISKTIIATALDETRPVLAGVYFYTKGDELKMVATDSYRLAEVGVKLLNKASKEISFIVPQRTTAELSRLITEKTENIKLFTGENQVEFQIGETIIVSRLIEGVFPEYEQIIPKTSKTKLDLPRAEFLNAIKMASIFAKESDNSIKLKVEDKKVEVVAVSPHMGDNVSAVSGKVEGENVTIAFNAKFVMDMLQVIESSEVIVELSGNAAAGLMYGEKDANYLYVIMPLRVEE